jgi:hypothetical protein
MNARDNGSGRGRLAWIAPLSMGALLLAGCAGVPAKSERRARSDLKTVERAYWPGADEVHLDAGAGLSNYLQFAILNQPQVRAAYFDWAASVDRWNASRWNGPCRTRN